jgi:hypothetical protein
MDNIFDRIVIAVPDLLVAVAQYQQMLGVTPFLLTNSQGLPAAWIGLPNTVLELVTGDVDQSRIQGLVFSPDAAVESDIPVSNALELDISLCNGRAVSDFRQEQVAAQVADLSIDHLVLRTADADACIDLFAGTLGLRLALDKTVPEWGGGCYSSVPASLPWRLLNRTGTVQQEIIFGVSPCSVRILHRWPRYLHSAG